MDAGVVLVQKYDGIGPAPPRRFAPPLLCCTRVQMLMALRTPPRNKCVMFWHASAVGAVYDRARFLNLDCAYSRNSISGPSSMCLTWDRRAAGSRSGSREGGRCMKGNFWIGLPPRRFAPPLLFQEGSRNLKLDHYLKVQLLRGSIRMRPHRLPMRGSTDFANANLDRCASGFQFASGLLVVLPFAHTSAIFRFFSLKTNR